MTSIALWIVLASQLVDQVIKVAMQRNEKTFLTWRHKNLVRICFLFLQAFNIDWTFLEAVNALAQMEATLRVSFIFDRCHSFHIPINALMCLSIHLALLEVTIDPLLWPIKISEDRSMHLFTMYTYMHKYTYKYICGKLTF